MASNNVCELSKRFGELVRISRKKNGLTQQQLADACAISRPSIVNIEFGRHGILLERAIILASFLGIDMNQFCERNKRLNKSTMTELKMKSLHAQKREIERKILDLKR